jgi:hypothetical protein
MTVMCAAVRLRALMAQQAARLITNPPIIFIVHSIFYILNISAQKHANAGVKLPYIIETHIELMGLHH